MRSFKFKSFLNWNTLIVSFAILFFITFCYPEEILLRNGSILQGEVIEIMDEGIIARFGRGANTVKFKWDELNESFAKRIFSKLFKKQIATESSLLGVRIKKYNTNKYIEGLNITEFSTQDAIFIKTKGKLIKLNRKVIEHIKPVLVNIFDVFSEKEIYTRTLKKYFKNKRFVHKLLFSRLKKYNMKIYKLHLLLHIISRYPTLPSYRIYKAFNRLFKKSLSSGDICVLNSLMGKNWFTVNFKELVEILSYVISKCDNQGLHESRDGIKKFDPPEIVLYSILFSNLMDLYIQSYSVSRPKSLKEAVDKIYRNNIARLRHRFGKGNAYFSNIWKNRKLNFFKVEGCAIKQREETFLRKWGQLSRRKRYLLFIDTFAKKYLTIVSETIAKRYSNIECYLYVGK
ncbi:MAG: hypothetical protein ACK4NF_01010 [Planctomycetota bacterium]